MSFSYNLVTSYLLSKRSYSWKNSCKLNLDYFLVLQKKKNIPIETIIVELDEIKDFVNKFCKTE